MSRNFSKNNLANLAFWRIWLFILFFQQWKQKQQIYLLGGAEEMDDDEVGQSLHGRTAGQWKWVGEIKKVERRFFFFLVLCRRSTKKTVIFSKIRGAGLCVDVMNPPRSRFWNSSSSFSNENMNFWVAKFVAAPKIRRHLKMRRHLKFVAA